MSFSFFDSSSPESCYSGRHIMVDEKVGAEGVGTYPLELFPEELWIAISKWIDSAQDFLNLCYASPQLDSILHPQKTAVLFPRVFPLISPHLKPKYVPALRKVSGGYKSVVDGYILQQQYTSLTCSRRYRIHFYTVNRLLSFTKEMKSFFCGKTKTSSSLLCQLIFHPDRRNDLEQRRYDSYWPLVASLAESVGYGISSCKFCLSGKNTDLAAESLVSIFIGCLSGMPNLEILSINADEREERELEYVYYLHLYKQDRKERLPKLPHLPLLRRLEYIGQNSYFERDKFLSHFLRQHGCPLQCLVLNQFDYVAPLILPELQVLQLNLFNHLEGGMFQVVHVGQSLRGSLESPSPLQKILLKIELSTQSDISHIFEMLNHFRETLVEIQVDLRMNVGVPVSCVHARQLYSWMMDISLPKVKVFKMTGLKGGSWLFLRALKSLEHLHIDEFKCTAQEGSGILYEKNFLKQLFDNDMGFIKNGTSIWEYFPKLRLLQVSNVKGTREGFVRYQNKLWTKKASLNLKGTQASRKSSQRSSSSFLYPIRRK